MNLSAVKRIMMACPDWVKAPLRLVPFALFCGPHYRKELALLSASDGVGEHALRAMQYERLINYANIAIERVPFYRDAAKDIGIHRLESVDQIRQFPIVTKQVLSERLDQFLDPRCVGRRYEVATGGSTGRPTRLFLSNDCYAREWAFVAHYLASCGLNLNLPKLTFRGVDRGAGGKAVSKNPLYKELLISPFRLTLDEVDRCWRDILSHRPTWLHGYPSSVAAFARIAKQLGRRLPGVKYALLVSEPVLEDQAAAIVDVFGCQILSFYGMSERVCFATKRERGMVPNRLYGFTESVDGRVVATGFLNQAMRVMRYDTGDEAKCEVADDGCVTRIVELAGRWGLDYLVGSQGQRIYMTALNSHHVLMGRIARMQFYQTSPGRCMLRVLPLQAWGVEDTAKLEQLYSEKCGLALQVKVEVVTALPLTKVGKHRMIECLCPEAGI